MNQQSSRDLFKDYTQKLCGLYSDEEARAQVQWLFEHFFGISRKDLLLDNKIATISHEFEIAFSQLLAGAPIQYILGKAYFYGREFFVSPSVLIPRFETEELVYLIIHENSLVAPNILDLGTGSGCIPITLSLEIPQSSVAGLDISSEALEIAIQNAGTLKANVKFFHVDILEEELPNGPWDIIVSNPPYVRYLERDSMHQNVVDHEPGIALFVPNDDPLLFYRTISRKAKHNLKIGGKLYFEINEGFGQEVKQTIEKEGFTDAVVHQDLQGKDRMISAVWLG